jgi:hypothetical protein
MQLALPRSGVVENAKKMRENDEKEAGMIDENMTADDR